MSTSKYFSAVCALVFVLALIVTVLFMNGERLGIRVIRDEDAEESEASQYFTSNDQNTDWAATATITLSGETATVSGPCPESIRRVAYCTGSGSSLLEEARAAGADIFITGDVKYHTALDTQLCLFDVGHHSLEEEMMRRAAIHLQHACPMLEVVFVPSASPFQPVHPRVL